MQFYYGQQMPLRILDECEFWKLQEQEHTVVIRVALVGLEPEFVEALEQWEQALGTTHQRVISFIESVVRSPYVYEQLYREVLGLVRFCLDQSNDFIELCRQIQAESATAQAPIAQTILDHIIRESEYFIGIARALLTAPMPR